MDKVKIFVVAEANKGKTTIASIIQDALAEQGFTKISIRDIPASNEAKQPIEQRIEAARARPIEIVVVNASPTTDFPSSLGDAPRQYDL